MTNDQALSRRSGRDPFQWSNYGDVFDQAPLLRYALNTMLYAALATLGLLVSSIPVAYALSRLRWRGRDASFLLVLATMMLPRAGDGRAAVRDVREAAPGRHAVAADRPELVRRRVLDLPAAPVLPDDPGGVLRRRARRRRGELRILLTVVLRLAKPAIAAVALFSFLYAWNDFFGPLLYTGENAATTGRCRSGWRTSARCTRSQWNLTMAATLLVHDAR